MIPSFKLLFALAVMAGFATLPTPSQAEDAKTDQAAAASATKKSPAASDDFEENRRLHMQKSKENNAKKGEN